MDLDTQNLSIHELEEKLKEYEKYIQNTHTFTTQKEEEQQEQAQRDSIVDDLLSEYRARNDTSNALPVETEAVAAEAPNYFSNLSNVSYGAFMIDDDDAQTYESKDSDWIDTLKIVDMRDNLRNLKKKKKTKKRKKQKKPDHKQSLAQKMADREDTNLTFQPKITAYEFNRRLDPNVQRRLEIWNMQKKQKLLLQRKAKLEENDHKMQEMVTFEPEIKEKKHSQLQGQAQAVQDRLYEREHQRIQKLAKTKQIIEAQQMEECSFKPKITKKIKIMQQRSSTDLETAKCASKTQRNSAFGIQKETKKRD
eukprot:444070_1